MNKFERLLFESNAFRVCEEGKPFWYTSGKIGPYFVNGHFLYGSEDDANSLLEFIDSELDNSNKEDIPAHIFSKVVVQYRSNKIYSKIIKGLIDFIKENVNVDKIDYISGGERRDWFFSNIIAYLLKKPHITIYKDLSCVLSNYRFTESKFVTKLEKKNVLHVADLLNQASSYLRAWIPAIKNINGNIRWSFVCIDRNQGGSEKLEYEYVKSYALMNINLPLFGDAAELGILTDKQYNMLIEYSADPDGTMKKFLLDHPDFLDCALNSDPKTAKRAKLCIDNDLYGLNER